ncbi:Cytochrome c oxidase subunit 6B [Dimargaris verticillata]|uniref:Cytochrome c oxidase subunit 6B n=1 Tax=Dimargaris verticillata TaxID=2761393 RepID=A0A9W8B330_9FUNG|nr:Cytochrome c oxidase subunit 6B [Dimargaris verticillata]
MEDEKQFKIKTAQFDARFPNTNQSKSCAQNYVDYYHCIEKRGKDFPLCKDFYHNFRSLCPDDWLEKWDNARNEDRSAFKLKPDEAYE